MSNFNTSTSTSTRIAKEMAEAQTSVRVAKMLVLEQPHNGMLRLEEQTEGYRSACEHFWRMEEVLCNTATLRARDWNGLIREVRAVSGNVTQAWDILRDVLANTRWGVNGSVFVTDKGLDHYGARRRIAHINGRPRVALDYKNRDLTNGWVTIFSLEEGEKMYREAKVLRVSAEVYYRTLREEVIEALLDAGHVKLSSFPGWEYYSGEQGGTFCCVVELREHNTRLCVSAEGALRGAWGLDWETCPEVNPRWTHLLPETVEEGDVEREFFGTKY